MKNKATCLFGASILAISSILLSYGFTHAEEATTPPPPPMATRLNAPAEGERTLSKDVTPPPPAQDDVQPAPQPEGATVPEPPAAAIAPPDADIEPEVLVRGPVHEAFAQPYEADPQPSDPVAKEPPDAIEEQPPESVPEGDNVQWIPGYWAWDDDREDYLWVSGLWRDVPPGQRWVPGYWTQADGGYQWVTGFWTAAEGPEIAYLPAPPQSLEQGPNIVAPSNNHFWIPGCWMYQNLNYQWRPGYWSACSDNWIWSPACYRWSPRGYIYTRGFWDYRFPRRGVLFAPVFFPRYRNLYYGYRYTPGFTIALGDALIHLWVRPRYNNYYFGNYYGQNYLAQGIRPWYRGTGRYYYDPLLAFYRPYYQRHGMDFDDRLNRWHNYYDTYPDRRPPVTLAQTNHFLEQHRDTPHISNAVLARPLQDVVQNQGDKDGTRFRTISQEQRREFASVSQDFRNLQRERTQFEGRLENRTGNRVSDTAGGTGQPADGASNQRGPDRNPTDRAFNNRDFSNRASNQDSLTGTPGNRDVNDRHTFLLPQDRTVESPSFAREQSGSDNAGRGRLGQALGQPVRNVDSASQLRVPDRPDTPRSVRTPELSNQQPNRGFEHFQNAQPGNVQGNQARSLPDTMRHPQTRELQPGSTFERRDQPSLSGRIDQQPPTGFDSNRSFENQPSQQFNRSLPQSTPDFGRTQPQFQTESNRSVPQSNRTQPQFSNPTPDSFNRSTPQFNRTVPQSTPDFGRSQPQFRSAPNPQFNRTQPQFTPPSSSFNRSAPQLNRSAPQQNYQPRSSGSSSSPNFGSRSFSPSSPPQFRSGGSGSSPGRSFSGSSGQRSSGSGGNFSQSRGGR